VAYLREGVGMRFLIRFAVMTTVCLALCVSATAEEAAVDDGPAEGTGPGLMDTIQNYLDKAETKVQETSLWKFKFGVVFEQRLIYDDNIFLNDDDEAGTEGRVWALISDTSLGFGLYLPVNPNYVKYFDKDKVKILDYKITVQEYVTRGDVDNIAHSFTTDLFSFWKDLFKIDGVGSRIYTRFKNRLDYVTDPLDLEVRDLRLIGFPTVKAVTELERWENRLDLEIGYEGNLIRGHVAYRNEYYHFDDKLFEQADHMEHTYAGRVGVNLPKFEDKFVYLEGRFRQLRYDENTLNDADAWEVVAGFEGTVISRKLQVQAECGYSEWDSSDDGKTADDSDYDGFIAYGQLVFRPWENRNIQFQLDGGRALGWSAIANYRVEDRGSVSVLYEVLPKLLDADLTLSVEKNNVSEGPDRILYSVGAGLKYHLFKQLDLTARYLYRTQSSKNEVELTDGTGDVVAESDGDFFQNVFSIGLSLKF
jgi:opacity protein-like surface antigen